ncbi:hypothetical protein ACFL4O_01000 [bacterium]
MKDYMASASAEQGEKISEEQVIESTAKTFSSNTVRGVKIMERWDDGIVAYSLAVLDIEDLKKITEEMKELNPEIKEYIKQNAEKAFDKLEQ